MGILNEEIITLQNNTQKDISCGNIVIYNTCYYKSKTVNNNINNILVNLNNVIITSK